MKNLITTNNQQGVVFMRFIPKPERNEVICIRIDADKLKFIDSVATQNNMSRNKFIGQCIDFALKNLDVHSQ